MHYDIEADWQLLSTCNYRCTYCWLSPDALGEKLTVHAEPDVWKRAIDRTGLTWHLHITGGEPTIYPRFAELCQLLTATHYLSLNSNLTHSSIVDFAKRVDPSRIIYINAGLHAAERELKKGLPKFLKHAGYLKERNFPIFITIVSTPDVLSRVDEVIALTAPIGLTPVPKLMRGAYKGKIYPEAYSAKERSTFIEFMARARGNYSPQPHQPAVESVEELIGPLGVGDESYLDRIPRFHGRMCSAGEKFVSMWSDGKIYRCEQKQSNYLGNILDGSLRLRTGKSPCDSDYCFYFCMKYSDAPRPGFSEPFIRSTQLFRRIRRSTAWPAIRSVKRAYDSISRLPRLHTHQ
jgi:MoaA/NifB/PqqE/SkfB family radical SAM enzyme